MIKPRSSHLMLLQFIAAEHDQPLRLVVAQHDLRKLLAKRSRTACHQDRFVRLGQVETLKESGSRAIGVRVFFGQRAASTYSSDFSAAGVERMLKSALELAKICSEDPYAGIPEAAQLGSLSGDLHLYHEDVYSLPGSERIEYARRA